MLNHKSVRAFILTIALLVPFTAWAQDIPAEYQQVPSTLGTGRDRMAHS